MNKVSAQTHFVLDFLWYFVNNESAIVTERCESPWIGRAPLDAVNGVLVLVIRR